MFPCNCSGANDIIFKDCYKVDLYHTTSQCLERHVVSNQICSSIHQTKYQRSVLLAICQGNLRVTKGLKRGKCFISWGAQNLFNGVWVWKVSLNLYSNGYIRLYHYNHVIMSKMVSQVTNVYIVCSSVSSGIDQSKRQSSLGGGGGGGGGDTGDWWIRRTKGQ